MRLMQINLDTGEKKAMPREGTPTFVDMLHSCNRLNESAMSYRCAYYVESVKPKPNLKLKVEHQQRLIDALNKRTLKWNPDYTDKRNRWDAMWSVRNTVVGHCLDEVYKYANDEHIDSFLRHYFGAQA